MRTTKRANCFLWTLAVLVAVPLFAAAQGPKIEPPTRVGVPGGQGDESGRVREGAWMPVYVKINAGPGGIKAGALRLVAEAPDVEETLYRNTLPLPALQANEDFFAITYLRATSSEFKVWLEWSDGRTVAKSESSPRASNAPLRGDDMLCLAIGISAPAGLHKSLVPPKQPANQQPGVFGPGGRGMKGQPVPPIKDDGPKPDPEDPDVQVENAAGDKRAAAPSFAHIGNMRDLPDHWYGYDAVDVVFLTTDSESFVKDLLNSKARLQALAEWVRRGGKLVVSVGNKADLVSELLQNMPMPGSDRGKLIDCDIEYNRRRRVLRSLNTWAGLSAEGPEGQLRNVTTAVLVPGRGTRVLLTEPAVEAPPVSPTLGLGLGLAGWQAKNADGYDREARPLIVDGACGLGRVLLVAFDLDSRPFTAWPGQEKVWERLRAEVVPGLRRSSGDSQYEQGPDERLKILRSEVETFGDVPTVHFGWVALFIVVYILIVGPLDYLLLAKVFKRLELTWLTFPTVVLTLSVGAYFGAYALKGDTRRLNKMDIVEIDLAGQQAYGTSWFAVFSPRIENYTLGVEPIFPGKAPTADAATDGHSAVVTVLESTQVFDTMRSGSGSLFNRPYSYAPAAAGLEKVPIPVWSIRSFTASWRTPLTGDMPIAAAPGPKEPDANTLALKGRGDGITVTGTIKNNLPVTLKDVTLFYHGRAYRQPGNRAFDLAPGAFFPVDDWHLMGDPNVGSGTEVSAWQSSQALVPTDYFDPKKGMVQKVHMSRGMVDTSSYAMPAHELAKELLFFNRGQRQREDWNPTGVQRDNAGLRRLDQQWRMAGEKLADNKNLRYLEEVILVARTEYVAQDDSQKVNEKSLVRLWIGELPKAGAKPPALVGQTTENTFVRAYIPVRPRD